MVRDYEVKAWLLAENRPLTGRQAHCVKRAEQYDKSFHSYETSSEHFEQADGAGERG